MKRLRDVTREERMKRAHELLREMAKQPTKKMDCFGCGQPLMFPKPQSTARAWCMICIAKAFEEYDGSVLCGTDRLKEK